MPVIEKAFLLDENDKPISPGGGLTADLKATQASEVSAGNQALPTERPGAERTITEVASTDPDVIARSVSWLSPFNRRRIAEKLSELPGNWSTEIERLTNIAEEGLARAVAAALKKRASNPAPEVTVGLYADEYIDGLLAQYEAVADDHWWIGSREFRKIERAVSRWQLPRDEPAAVAAIEKLTRSVRDLVNQRLDARCESLADALIEKAAAVHPERNFDRSDPNTRATFRDLVRDDVGRVFDWELESVFEELDETTQKSAAQTSGPRSEKARRIWPSAIASWRGGRWVRHSDVASPAVRSAGAEIQKATRLERQPDAAGADIVKAIETLADRPQEITVTVNLDEARLAQALAAAMKPKGDVEVLARNAIGQVALMRRADGTVVRFKYDAMGAIVSITPVENVEAELAWLKIAEAKVSAEKSAYTELAKVPGEVGESARRVLRQQPITAGGRTP